MRLFYIFASTFLCANVSVDVLEDPDYDGHVKSCCNSLYGSYSSYHLKNKLEVVIHEHDDFTRPFEASLSVGVGSSGVSKKHPVWEQPILEGLAHLLEHCLFYANRSFTTSYDFEKFIKLHGGYLNGSTFADHTLYELRIPPKVDVTEALWRFASMFSSPIFTKESIQTQISIVNNEWLERKTHSTNMLWRYIQLLMTKGEPSELFGCGDSTSLNGDVDVLLDQLELFWKTHYTADNMKLAISLHRRCKDTVKQALGEYFVYIPSSDPKKMALSLPPSHAPFWSDDHKDHYLEIYTQNDRRNHLYLFWHISCDEGAACHDSLEMIVQSIQVALTSRFPDLKCSAGYKSFSYNQFVVAIIVSVRDSERFSLNNLKNQIVETVRNNAPVAVIFGNPHVGFSSPQKLTKRLSEVMALTKDLTEVPLRTHLQMLVDVSTKVLNSEHWKLINEEPRVAVSYKLNLLKDALVNRETLLVDRYTSIHYQFADSLGRAALAPVAMSSNASNPVLSLKFNHPFTYYPFQFMRGVFIEMIRIILKEKQLKFNSFLGNVFFKFDIHFTNIDEWEVRMKEVMDALATPTDAVLEKAKNRWLREMQKESSSLYFSYIAEEYAEILISPNPVDEIYLLISDPNPENVALDKFKALRGIFQSIASLEVSTHLMSNMNITDADINIKMRILWMSGLPPSIPCSKFKQPARGETFIYAPPPLLPSKSGVMMLFKLDQNFAVLVKNILDPFFYMRLRSDMKLTYSPTVDIISGTHLYINVSSPHTPDYVQNCIISVIKEIPNYIRGLSELEWLDYVYNYVSDQTRGMLLNPDGRERLIEIIEHCLFEEKGSSRLIIQFWGKHQDAARDAYLKEIKRTNPPSFEVISSIVDYPREP